MTGPVFDRDGLSRPGGSIDFVHESTHDARTFRMVTLIDLYTHECLVIDVSRRMTSELVLEDLSVQQVNPRRLWTT